MTSKSHSWSFAGSWFMLRNTGRDPAPEDKARPAQRPPVAVVVRPVRSGSASMPNQTHVASAPPAPAEPQDQPDIHWWEKPIRRPGRE